MTSAKLQGFSSPIPLFLFLYHALLRFPQPCPLLPGLRVIRGQCCPRVAAAPSLPNGRFTQLSPYFTRKPGRYENSLISSALPLSGSQFLQKLAQFSFLGFMAQKYQMVEHRMPTANPCAISNLIWSNNKPLILGLASLVETAALRSRDVNLILQKNVSL